MTRPEMTTGQFWASAIERAVKTNAGLSLSLAVLAGGLWLGTRTYSHPGG